jgi:ferredoxin
MVGEPRGRGSVRITIDETRCCGSGNCALYASDLFSHREDDGVAVVLDSSPPESRYQDIQAVVEGCPTSAISVAEFCDLP